MTLAEYLSQLEVSWGVRGMSGWLDFAELSLVSGQLFVGDPLLYPDGVTIPLEPGRYRVQVRLLVDAEGWVCAGLRVIHPELADPVNQAVKGASAGIVTVDFGSVGVADRSLLQAAVSRLPLDAYNRMTRDAGIFGVLPWDPDTNALMPHVRSGYGDGAYPVHSLVVGTRRAGIQVDFLVGHD